MTAPIITRELQEAMLGYSWPGNVREVENVMRRYLVYQDADVLLSEIVQLSSTCAPPVREAPGSERSHETNRVNGSSNGNGNNGNVVTMDHLEQSSRQAETKLLLDALGATRWNRRQAAAQLKIDYKAFLYKLQKYGIVEKAKRGEVGA